MKKRRNHKLRNKFRAVGRMFKREAPIDLELTMRSLQVRADSFDESSRSVEAILATENRVTVFDWGRFEPIDEILIMPRQDSLPAQLPLLENHRRSSIDDVLGSVRNFRIDGDKMPVRLFFDTDDRSTRAMNKVKNGHVRDVSVGYRVLPGGFIDIAPRKTVTVRIRGEERTFTSGERVLRISIEWRAREGSLTPIGADELAKIRQEYSSYSSSTNKRSDETMNDLLRQYLESLGLARDAKTTEAWTFFKSLAPNQRAIADKLLERGESPPGESSGSGGSGEGNGSQAQSQGAAAGQRSTVNAGEGNGANQGQQGQQFQNVAATLQVPDGGLQPRQMQPRQTGVSLATAEPLNLTAEQRAGLERLGIRLEQESEVDRGRRLERERVTEIEALGRDIDEVPNDLVRQAIDEGWEVDNFRERALQTIRQGRANPPNTGAGEVARHLGIHSRSRENDMTAAALSGALMLRGETPLDYNFGSLRAASVRNAQFIQVWRLDVNNDQRQQAMEFAHRYSDLSMEDICRRAIELDGNDVPRDFDEMLQRAAVSGGSLLSMFTTNINAELLPAYVDAGDTTMGWMDETDVRDFQPHERAQWGKFGSLTRHAPGKTADHMDTGSNVETSKIQRFSGQWVIDEMDIINDRFGSITQMAPRDIGLSAAQLRPDLVYALILSNPSLQTTGQPVFGGTGQDNQDTLVLGESSLESAISKMMQKRQRGRPLNIAMRALVVNPQLKFTGERLLMSDERRNPAATGGEGTLNVLQNAGVGTLASDDRLGPNGVIDPRTGTAYTGSNTIWFGFARPRERGAKTGVVKYRRGTGRAPSIRGYVLDKGQWGLGWDIKHDIGASFDDWRGCYQGNS